MLPWSAGMETTRQYTENIAMWHQYHKVRTTQLFTKKWVDFVSLSTSEPVFYQYVTDVVFKELIQARFPVVSHQRSVTITNKEANVIRYAAGYTLRTLRKKIERGSHPLKEEMVLTTMELVADDEDDDLLLVPSVHRG